MSLEELNMDLLEEDLGPLPNLDLLQNPLCLLDVNTEQEQHNAQQPQQLYQFQYLNPHQNQQTMLGIPQPHMLLPPPPQHLLNYDETASKSKAVTQLNVSEELAMASVNTPSSFASSSKQLPTTDNSVSAQASSKPRVHCTEIKLPRKNLESIPDHVIEASKHLHFLNLNRNNISWIPQTIKNFSSLVELNLGRNNIQALPKEFTHMTSLVRLDLSGNRIRNLPTGFSKLKALQQLQLNGNQLTELSEELFELTMLLKLYVGGNQISIIPKKIKLMRNLQVLYLGGNNLSAIPAEIAGLFNLEMLYLGDNHLSTIPREMCRLGSLRTLNLHNNNFAFLPKEIVKMPNLQNISLRGNPLVTEFVNNEVSHQQPLSLKELSARAVKLSKITVNPKVVPVEILNFLNSARKCNNPACAGVYFKTSVKNLEIVDFCGKFRVPLIEFLCNKECVGDEVAYPACARANAKPCAKKMKKVLLDNYGFKCDCIACTAEN